MICEYCSKEHKGSYGSGRFCSSKCARGFSTRDKRKEINRKVSKTLKESGFKPTTGHYFTKEEIERGKETRRKRIAQYIQEVPFSSLSKNHKKRKILLEQESRCQICGMKNIWNGETLTFNLDHINGDRKNNSRKNLRLICPNCDRQLPTYGSKNASLKGKKRMAENGQKRNTSKFSKKYLEWKNEKCEC